MDESGIITFYHINLLFILKQSLRIIGGQYRGKKLFFPDIPGLRPTPDRIRETLFNWLMHDIHQARCLDAFAGSGALGFEAFSRGAGEVIFIEKDLTAYLNLKKISGSFESSKLTVIHQDAVQYISQQTKLAMGRFDIIFMDPPFAHPFLLNSIHLLSTTHMIATGGLLYIESQNEVMLDLNDWVCLKSKRSGQIHYGLYRKK